MRNMIAVLMGASAYAMISMGFELAESYLTEGYGLHPMIVIMVTTCTVLSIGAWCFAGDRS